MEEVCPAVLVKQENKDRLLLKPLTQGAHIAPSFYHSPSHLLLAASSSMQDDLWHLPGRLRINPSLWDKEDVALWLVWAQKEYSLRPLEKGHFEMNGRALCLLTKEDFRRRCPSSGDVLYEILQCVKQQRRKACETPQMPKTCNATQIQSPVCSLISSHSTQPAPAIPDPSSTITAPPQCSLRDPPLIVYQPHTPLTQNNESTIKAERSLNNSPDPEPLNLSSRKRPRSPIQAANGRIPECRLLWDYVYQLLCDERYQEYIRWEDPDSLVFRVVDPNGLARLWGNHKNRDNMTYEKMSRALRHYYKLNIIKKERGQKLLFRFLKTPQDIQKHVVHDEPSEYSPDHDRDNADPSPIHEEHHFELSPENGSPKSPPAQTTPVR
ncbi:transcription factor ETV7 [Boleophthalmus pectinirostris]|uniref:transcription factor ETV7 n=1 Tax=Boleophthalmus pectinirostris TaxID=150288 RepID=UPI00242E748A|nr:transcription factor ETV7 [Boleophthalmus pectinirostris]